MDRAIREGNFAWAVEYSVHKGAFHNRVAWAYGCVFATEFVLGCAFKDRAAFDDDFALAMESSILKGALHNRAVFVNEFALSME